MVTLTLLMVLGRIELSTSATAGVTLSTQDLPSSTTNLVSLSPQVSASLDLERSWSVGTLRARWVPLLVMPQLGNTPLPGQGVPAAATVSLQDLASFLEFESQPLAGTGPRFAARLYPFQANSRLVSFDWANAVTRVQAPVLSFDVRGDTVHAWLAARFSFGSPVNLGLTIASPVVYPEVLGGVGWSGERVRLEARAGRTQYGPPALSMMSEPLQWGFVAAGQGVFHLGEEVPAALDLVTYAQDPTRFARFFAPPAAPLERLAVTVSVEVGAGTQFVTRGSMPPGESSLLPGWVDLQARLRWKRSRFFLTARAQSSAFLTFDQVLLVNTLLSGAGSSTPLLAGYLGADHSFAGAKLTPQLLVRVVQPATVRSQFFGGNAPPPGLASSVLVLREGGRSRLVAGDPATRPTLGAKLALRWNPVEQLTVVGEVDVAVDLMEALLTDPLPLTPAGRAGDDLDTGAAGPLLAVS
ncbi:MAG: hypothetical protein ABTQ32_26665 [Myxococcaceae bacterium]